MFSRQVFRTVRAAAPQRALAVRATPVRTFAAAAANESQPPIAVFGVDGTYASALVRIPFTYRRPMVPRGELTRRPLGFSFFAFPRGQLGI